MYGILLGYEITNHRNFHSWALPTKYK